MFPKGNTTHSQNISVELRGNCTSHRWNHPNPSLNTSLDEIEQRALDSSQKLWTNPFEWLGLYLTVETNERIFELQKWKHCRNSSKCIKGLNRHAAIVWGLDLPSDYRCYLFSTGDWNDCVNRYNLFHGLFIWYVCRFCGQTQQIFTKFLWLNLCRWCSLRGDSTAFMYAQFSLTLWLHKYSIPYSLISFY